MYNYDDLYLISLYDCNMVSEKNVYTN